MSNRVEGFRFQRKRVSPTISVSHSGYAGYIQQFSSNYFFTGFAPTGWSQYEVYFLQNAAEALTDEYPYHYNAIVNARM